MASPLGEITLCLLLALLMASGCAGREFIVASGPNGWTVPDEPLEQFFQINDTLVFKDVDAVLWVSRSHYDACNTTLPFLRLAHGDSPFVLNNPGSSYCFISADARRCRDGARLIAIVLHQHNNTPSSPMSASPPTSPPPPVPVTKKGTGPPSTSSSAVALRAGVLAYLLVGASTTSLGHFVMIRQ